MIKKKVVAIQKQIDDLDAKLATLNVSDPLVSDQVKKIKIQLVELHSIQGTEITNRMAALNSELDELDVNGPKISNRIKAIKDELLALQAELDAE